MPYQHITLKERYVIYHLLLMNLSFREMGPKMRVRSNIPTFLASTRKIWGPSMAPLICADPIERSGPMARYALLIWPEKPG